MYFIESKSTSYSNKIECDDHTNGFDPQGGVHVYYMLTAYLTSWPTALFRLLTVEAAAYGHGGKYLMQVIN